MNYINSNLIIALVVLLMGVGGFALFSTGQSKIPQIYYVEFGEQKAEKAGKRHVLSSTIEDKLIQYDVVKLTVDDFSNKVINEYKTLDENNEESLSAVFEVIEFPGENQALFQLSEYGSNVDDYIAWVMENNIDEVYLFSKYIDPDADFQHAHIPSKMLNYIDPNQILEFLLPKNAFAANIPGPNCTTGVLRPDGWTRVVYRPKLASQCSADNNGYADLAIHLNTLQIAAIQPRWSFTLERMFQTTKGLMV